MRKNRAFALAMSLGLSLAIAPISPASAKITKPTASKIISISSSAPKKGLVNVTIKIALPSSNGGSKITGSSVTAGGKTCTMLNLKTSCTIKGIKKGKALRVVAKSKNLKGFGSASIAVTYKAGAKAYAFASSSATVVPIPIALPVSPLSTITFENAVSQYASVPEVAWRNVQSEINQGTNSNKDISIYVGPHTDVTETLMREALNKEFKLFNGFSTPPNFTGIAYSFADLSWAETKWSDVVAARKYQVNASGYLSKIRQGCDSSECSGGMAVVLPNSLDGFSFYGVQNGNFWTDQNQAGVMTQVNHELTHNIQFAQFNGVPLRAGENTRSDQSHHASPCWFSEGQANAIGIPIFQTSLEAYKSARDYSVTRPVNPGTTVSLTNFSQQSIKSFLMGQDPLTCYNPDIFATDWQLGYSVGYAATEVLVAIGGARSTMALLSSGARGQDWATSFQSVYGTTWEQGATILSEVLARQYAAQPMR